MNRRQQKVWRRGRGRRGATLVLVCILITVLLGFTGVAFDFGRMYLFKAQLQTTADAAALAGVIDLVNNSPTTAQATALSYVPLNLVEKDTATVADSDVVPGTWDFDTHVFTPLVSWTDPAVNAVRVIAHYPAFYTFGHVFGETQTALRTESVAALGSVGSSSCLKPWAVPYTNILATLGHDPSDLSYDLTNEDVNFLRTSQKLIAFKIASQQDSGSIFVEDSAYIPGNYYAVEFPIELSADGVTEPYGSPVSGDNVYRDLIGSSDCLSSSVSVGDWLQTEPGDGNGPTDQGVGDLCGTSGNSGVCDPPRDVFVPIWAEHEDKNGKSAVQVKYIGAFVVTGYDQGQVFGYLKALGDPSGGFSPEPGPLKKGVLVQ
ncbi:MAG TPA: pilus assembly protein TadG-related protein [Gemmatimonadaceae bacterium]|nr:pilus assembly protein TadG-related protein [Gemmatimonadaceae bacterium]